jgi:hypothetical protein
MKLSVSVKRTNVTATSSIQISHMGRNTGHFIMERVWLRGSLKSAGLKYFSSYIMARQLLSAPVGVTSRNPLTKTSLDKNNDDRKGNRPPFHSKP